MDNRPLETVVTETGQGQFTQKIVIGQHELAADEPIASGGKDLGPSPYDFLLAGLGACTSMTVRMYAKRKQIPLERITVTLTHEKIHSADCEDCENKNALMDYISRRIHLEGDLSEEQRQALLGIANKCPVHRTLTSKITIDTQLVD